MICSISVCSAPTSSWISVTCCAGIESGGEARFTIPWMSPTTLPNVVPYSMIACGTLANASGPMVVSHSVACAWAVESAWEKVWYQLPWPGSCSTTQLLTAVA